VVRKLDPMIDSPGDFEVGVIINISMKEVMVASQETFLGCILGEAKVLRRQECCGHLKQAYTLARIITQLRWYTASVTLETTLDYPC
jgi:hypothetical protein